MLLSRTGFIFIFLVLFSKPALGYPQFIGYKYSSCITCHFNGQGGGGLSDYGRALWSAEIAGRAFAGKKSDEQLGESSGFLGKTELPWWIRPGFKTRNLIYQTNPPDGPTRDVFMQAEGNVALFFDQDQKYAVIGSFGYVPVPRRFENSTADKPDTWISREHYFRWQASDNLWIYTGMMDKVYGLRIVNHTAYSRKETGIAQNDQTHGVMAHYIQPTWELSVHGFAGNLSQDADLRQQGASTLFEYEIKEAFRVGATALYSSNKFIKNQRMGVLTKYGMGHGSALLAELGTIENTVKGQETDQGYYLYSEAMQKMFRGYHAFIAGQLYKDSMEGGKADNVRTTLGLLAFPLARVEVRVEFENTRQMTNSSAVERDTWAWLAQLHLSL